MKKQYCIIIIILLNILISNFVFANEKINTNKKVENPYRYLGVRREEK